MSGDSRSADAAPSLPAGRTFVVQFRASSEQPLDGALRGRVEHLVSGFAARFDTWSELREIVEYLLRDADEPPRSRGMDVRRSR
jgi:hypothetical protein